MKNSFWSRLLQSYRLRILTIVFVDAASICVSYLMGLWLRFDLSVSKIPHENLISTLHFIPLACVTTIFVYTIMRLYHSIWRFASLAEAYRAAAAYIILAPVLYIETKLPGMHIPRSVLLAGYIFSAFACVGIRFGYRFLRYFFSRTRGNEPESTDASSGEKVLLVGAGQAAREIIRDIRMGHQREMRVVTIVDDNVNLRGRYLEGIKIEGSRDDIPMLVEKHGIRRIVFAIPSAPPAQRKAILDICKDTGCRVQTVPGLYQIINNEVSVSQIRDVDIADLLGREEVKVNNEEITRELRGKVVMVTGAGGSIGSELCRQIAKAGPRQLIVFDIYENNAYDIQQELRRSHPELNLVVRIGSVRNTNRVNTILQEFKPDIIYHAAAHKHVPLMEESPNEAIKNNTIGTYKLAKAAAATGVKRFLLISTDKAVNPTNIMGASKRLCEMVIQMMDRQCPNTVFMAVRFGNVLGSNGSVIPLFKKQIAAGGPVTLTSRNVVRYFMTIPEAVSLVLQAGSYAKGGEIFILDMGEPVRILDLANNLIKLSGLKPGEDIEIVEIGLREGEKEFEELLMDEEGLQKTAHGMIYVGKPIKFDDEVFQKQLAELDVLSKGENERIKEIVAEIVPTYTPRGGMGQGDVSG